MEKFYKCIFILVCIIGFHTVHSQQILSPDWSTESNVTNASMGSNLGEAGDLNGDGYKELFVVSAGKINIYYGSSSGFSTTPTLVLQETGVNYYAITHGDVNNDGKDELITGDRTHNTFRIFYGSSSVINTVADYIYTAPENTGGLGYGIDANGDINNDGYDDVIVGQPSYNRGNGLYGKVLVFRGSSGGIASSPDQVITTIYGTIGIGQHVVYAGDVNKDGYQDVLISSQAVAGVPLLSSERVQLYTGGNSGNLTINSWYDLGRVITLEKAFDINGDSYADIAVTYYDPTTANYTGRVFYGHSSGLELNPSFEKDMGTDGRLTAIGDFNNDSYADIVIDNQFYSEGSVLSQGRIGIYTGSSAGISSSPYYYP